MHYCNIPTSCWSAEHYKKLSIRERTLAYYTMTNSAVNCIGVYHLPISNIVTELCLDHEEIAKALQELINIDFCRYDYEFEYIWIRNYAFWQKHTIPIFKTLKQLPIAKIHSWPAFTFIDEFCLCYEKFNTSLINSKG